ncbi:DNA repair protein RecO [Candidatus Berkelbacteria bacterium CG10_big_fil_rev_8_21_14_0_10_41_12]|uniref:DNA repair protein RecO n=1 Tax=Candidatus Berkelbacteria bacterium CG10_big_fil_rev_8_21_14_0_10_41_12 TaxID=1974513 RepID=A0A2M6WWD5_9BACT|nr:MAG: DNA repair protein RecO [Candidatus Berkelbacteria bacterium CG10_big_fil_rev_8_21_14_0_10_41_12]
MSSYKFEGVVIKVRNFSEADKIITFFTREFGKRDLVAKGVKKIKSRKSPFLDLGSINKIFAAETKGLDIISEVENIYLPKKISGDLGRTYCLSFVLEVTNKLFQEEEDHRYIYKLLKETIRLIDKRVAESIRLIFVLKILDHNGYLGDLKECSVCGGDLRKNELFSFSKIDGDISHRKCHNELCLDLSDDELKLLKSWVKLPIGQAVKIKAPKKIMKKIEDLAIAYWEINVGYDIKSEKGFTDVIMGRNKSKSVPK